MYPQGEQPRVRFEEEARAERFYSASVPASGMAAWLVRHSGGLLKSEQSANYALIGFAVIAVVISAFFALGNRNPGLEPPTQELIDLPIPREGDIPH